MSPQDERLQRLREALDKFDHRLTQTEERVERCAERVPHLESSIRSGVERNGLLNGLLDMLIDTGVNVDADDVAIVTAEVVAGEPAAHSVALVNALTHFVDEH